MNNTLILIDALSGALNVALKIQDVLQKAAIEGRDVSQEELDELASTTQLLRAQWDAENDKLN